MDTPALPCALRSFRSDLHGCFRRRADALFELVDALLATDAVGSLPHLSPSPLHRRGWGSVYDALADGCTDVEALRAAVARHPLADAQPAYAVDVSVWPRCDAADVAIDWRFTTADARIKRKRPYPALHG